MLSLFEMKVKVGMLFMYNISVCVTEMGFTSLFIGGRAENSVYPDSCNVWSCLFLRWFVWPVVLDDAEVSVLDRYKSFISCCVVVAGGEVLSVCVCKDSSACRL